MFNSKYKKLERQIHDLQVEVRNLQHANRIRVNQEPLPTCNFRMIDGPTITLKEALQLLLDKLHFSLEKAQEPSVTLKSTKGNKS